MKAAKKKELEKQMENMTRKDEYNNMQKNIKLKAILENFEKE